MSSESDSPFDLEEILRRTIAGKALLSYPTGQIVYAQSAAADCVFYLKNGSVNVTVRTTDGKETVVETLKDGSFFGEECVVGHQKRTATASANTESTLMRIEKTTMFRLLREEPAFTAFFIDNLVARASAAATKGTRSST